MDNKKKYEVIYHTSDWHIDPNREKEYFEVISKFAKIISDDPREKMIVIAGDMFKNKTKTILRENYMIMDVYEKLYNIGCPVILIPGNHDYNINSKSYDNLIDGSLRKSIYTKNLICYSKSGIYEHGNVVFVVMSPIDSIEEKDLIIPKRESNKIYVAILHETINGVVYQNGHNKVYDKRFNAEKLEKIFDLVLLGDIHLWQFLGKDERIGYPGSPIQQSLGELWYGHGFMVWELKTLSGKFIELENNYGMLKVKASNDKILTKLPDRSMILHQVSIHCEDCTDKFIKNLIDEINKKHTVKHFHDPINKLKNKEVCSSITDSKDKHIDIAKMQDFEFQMDAIKRYMEETKVEPKLAQQITLMHLDKLRDGADIVFKSWRLISLRFDNMYCYREENYIDFRTLDGIVALIGPNKTGKSTIIDVLIYALYGKNPKGNASSVVNNKFKHAKVEVQFEVLSGTPKVPNDIYIVRKLRQNTDNKENKLDSKDKGKVTIQLLKNGTNITIGDLKQTYAQIANIIGSYEVFIHSAVSCQDGEHQFIKLPREAPEKLLGKIAGIERLAIIHKNIKSQELNLKKQLEFMEKPENMPSPEELKRINDQKDSTDKELKMIRAKITELEQQKTRLIEQQSEKTDKINDESKKLDKIRDTLREIEQKINTTNSSITVSEHQIREFTSMITKNESLITRYKEKVFIYDRSCQKCKENQFAEVQKLTIPELESELATLQKENQEIEAHNQEINKSIDIEQKKYDTTNAELIKLNTEKQQMELELSLLRERIVRAIQDVSLLISKITNIQQKIDSTNKLENTFSDSCKECKINKKIKDQVNSIKALEQGIEELKVEEQKNITKLSRAKENEIKLNEQKVDHLKHNKEIRTKIDTVTTQLLTIQSTIRGFDPIKIKNIQAKLSNIDQKYPVKFDDKCQECCKNKSVFGQISRKQEYEEELRKLNEEKLQIDKLKEQEIQITNELSVIKQSLDNNNKLIQTVDSQITANSTELFEINTAMIKIKNLFSAFWEEIDKVKSGIDQFNYKCLSCKKNRENNELKSGLNEMKNNAIKLSEEKSGLELQIVTYQSSQVTKQKELETILTNIKDKKNETNNLKQIMELNNTKKKRLLIDDIKSKQKNIDKINKFRYSYNLKCNDCQINKKIETKTEPIKDLEDVNSQTTQQIGTCATNIGKSKDIIANLIEQKTKLYENDVKICKAKQSATIEYEKFKQEFNSILSSINKQLVDHNARKDNQFKTFNDSCKFIEKYMELKKKHEEYGIKYQKIDDDVKVLSKYKDILDKKKGLPRTIVSKIAEMIQDKMNKFLNKVCDFEFRFGFGDKSVKTFICNKNGDDCNPSLSGSGFQRFVVNLAFRLSLGKISHIPILRCLILDEGFGCLDDSNFEKVSIVMNSIKDSYDFILIISHIRDMNDSADSLMIIDKSKGYSKLVHGIIPSNIAYDNFPGSFENVKNNSLPSDKKDKSEKSKKEEKEKSKRERKPKEKIDESKTEIIEENEQVKWFFIYKGTQKIKSARCKICTQLKKSMDVEKYNKHITSEGHKKKLEKWKKKK